jgi:hypothetical protein
MFGGQDLTANRVLPELPICVLLGSDRRNADELGSPDLPSRSEICRCLVVTSRRRTPRRVTVVVKQVSSAADEIIGPTPARVRAAPASRRTPSRRISRTRPARSRSGQDEDPGRSRPDRGRRSRETRDLATGTRCRPAKSRRPFTKTCTRSLYANTSFMRCGCEAVMTDRANTSAMLEGDERVLRRYSAMLTNPRPSAVAGVQANALNAARSGRASSLTRGVSNAGLSSHAVSV